EGAGRTRRAVLPRLRRDGRLLQQPGGDEGRDRRRRLAAHRRRGEHGSRRLLPDHRPHQGFDHPRRGKNRAPGDRGSPARARGGRRRVRLRLARRVLRRDRGRSGPAEARRPGRRRQRARTDRVVRELAREIQGAQARALRVGLPDDRVGQDSEIQAAPGSRAAAEGATNMTARIVAALLVIASAGPAAAQPLSPKWEELTAADFVRALDRSANGCVLPFGIIEKHGPAGPLGTDLINARYTTLLAAADEYAIVF